MKGRGQLIGVTAEREVRAKYLTWMKYLLTRQCPGAECARHAIWVS